MVVVVIEGKTGSTSRLVPYSFLSHPLNRRACRVLTSCGSYGICIIVSIAKVVYTTEGTADVR
jgi:hypothetical protein